MTMDNKEERRKALREEFDIPSAIAAAASYEGLPILTRPILEKLPMGIAEGLMSGQKITAEAGTPLSRIAKFTRGEVRAIENFARESGVKVPIVSLPTVRAGGAFIDPTTPITRAEKPSAGSWRARDLEALHSSGCRLHPFLTQCMRSATQDQLWEALLFARSCTMLPLAWV